MPLLRDTHGAVVSFTLSNPDKRNALDPSLCAELAAGIAEAAAGGARALVLTGAGDKAFSAGYDLDALTPGDAAAERPFEALLEALAASPLPIVAALNGAAFGGGCELAAACDLRVAHREVKLAMPPARLGIIYAARGLARFSALVGESRARELFLCARVVDGERARAWGLIDHLVPAADVLPRARGLAEEMAGLAPLAVQGMRRTFEALLARRADPGPLAAEIEALRVAAWISDDTQDRLRRARARTRPPPEIPDAGTPPGPGRSGDR